MSARKSRSQLRSFGFSANISLASAAFFLAIAVSSARLWGDATAIGADGVNATATSLTGLGFGVGQLEGGRPAGAPPDTTNTNILVQPTAFFAATPTNSWANFDQSPHAEEVAGTIISTGPVTAGIAQDANLYSGDIFDNNTITDIYRNGIITGQKLDQQGIVALNMSFGYAIPTTTGGYGKYGAANVVMDSTSQFTQYVDWSASKFNVVNAVAGNETGNAFGLDVPTDSYNSLVVGSTSVDGNGVFDTMSSFNVVNELPTNGRRTIDIVAPGDDVTLATFGNGNSAVSGGTSFATPLVTGAVALVDQEATNEGDGADAFNNQVSRAILLNSADKVQGILGMDHTILRGTVATNNTGGTDATGAGLNWVQERAAEVANGVNRNSIPLDSQLGVGQLNVRRAQIQMDSGEQKPGPVNYLGWDYNTVKSGMTSQTYALPPIQAGQWLSATLTWNRGINLNETLTKAGNPIARNGTFDAETYTALNAGVPINNGMSFNYQAGDDLTDVNGNGTYDNISESFSPASNGANGGGLNDLDLFILPHGDTNLADAVATSNSSIYNLEQVFFQLPQATVDQYGTNYDIEVLARDLTQANNLSQDYGLAWWTAQVPEPGVMTLFGVGFVAMARRRSRRAAA